MKYTKNIEKLIGKFCAQVKAAAKTTAELDRKIMEDALPAQEKSRKTQPAIQPNLWRVIMNNRITKLTAAAVVAIALLVPLSYGTSNIIKKLVAGSVEYDDYQGEFSLGRDIRFELIVGTKEQENIVSTRNIRFFVENDELKGTLRCSVRCLPKYKWMTTIELFDVQDKKLASTEHVNENAGVEVSYINSSPRDIHFSLGRWGKTSKAQKFRIGFKKVPENTKTTPDAWIESGELDVIHGRVTGPGGKPVAHTIVQIREKRKPGQSSIAAPNVITDKQGFYIYDEIKWPYSVGASVYESDTSSPDYKHQFKRLNKYQEGSQTVNFEFDEFPTGNASIFGRAERPDGQAIKQFSVDVRLQVDFEDYSPEYLYQFGYRKFFTNADGKYEISNLPAGIYKVSIHPNQTETIERKDYLTMRYVCELQEGQRIEIGVENAREKVWYGRVLFEDGTAAVPDLEGFETQIITCATGQESPIIFPDTKVEDDGYFALLKSDEAMDSLKSGKTYIRVSIRKARSSRAYEIQEGEIFPVECLSPERDKAGVVKISRPDIYYGRILYENGKPAVPEVIPWPGATVSVILRYSPATAKSGGHTKDIGDLDGDGYFSAYLTNEQIEKVKTGEYSIQIYHPSYEHMRASYPIMIYPFEMLSTEKNNVKGYKLSSGAITATKLKDINNILESIEKLKKLFAALKMYANDHQGSYPGMIELLDIKADDFQWLAENVEYITSAKAQTASKPAETVLAYDKMLLKKNNATLVLFRDGHIEYCWSRQLEILGILRMDTDLLQ